MKIDLTSLIRTNLGFPSEWKGKTVDGKEVKISYRYGKTKVSVNDVLVATLSIDQFDVGGYMDDEDLHKLLRTNGHAE
jgi:hypothetical protein